MLLWWQQWYSLLGHQRFLCSCCKGKPLTFCMVTLRIELCLLIFEFSKHRGLARKYGSSQEQDNCWLQHRIILCQFLMLKIITNGSTLLRYSWRLYFDNFDSPGSIHIKDLKLCYFQYFDTSKSSVFSCWMHLWDMAKESHYRYTYSHPSKEKLCLMALFTFDLSGTFLKCTFCLLEPKRWFGSFC